MIKVDPQVEFNETEFMTFFNGMADEFYEYLARKCAVYAVSNINSHSGNLALSVKARKSKFKDGGWICVAETSGGSKGFHAFLVEYGTDGPRFPLKKGGLMKFEIDGREIFAKVVAPMPAKPFMRPARERVMSELRQGVR